MQIHQFMDACLFGASFWLAHKLRSNQSVMDFFGMDPVDPFVQYIWFYLVLILVAPLILEGQGYYDRPLLGPRWGTLWPLFRGCLFSTVGLIAALFVFKYEIARWIVIWFGFISFGLILVKEELFRLAYQRKVSQTQHRRRFVLIGLATETAQMKVDLKTHPDANIEIVAQLDLNVTSLPQLVNLLHEHSVNGVVVCARHAYFEQVEAVIQACELEGVEAWLVADFFATQISRTTFDDFYGRPVMVFRSTPETSWQLILKQIIDYLGAFVGVILLSPVLAGTALLIKLTSPGPVLFRQLRSGLNGAPFTIYKFRTMVTNAEQMQHELQAMNEMSGPVFKVSQDPRITRMGKWLRRTSVDELPQLFNVLRGDMSLVGPRPLPVDEVRRFNDPAHRRRLSVKPGITCLWQISGRNEIKDFKDWVRLDLEYIDRWSLWLDLDILLRTLPAVLRATGAK